RRLRRSRPTVVATAALSGRSAAEAAAPTKLSASTRGTTPYRSADGPQSSALRLEEGDVLAQVRRFRRDAECVGQLLVRRRLVHVACFAQFRGCVGEATHLRIKKRQKDMRLRRVRTNLRGRAELIERIVGAMMSG